MSEIVPKEDTVLVEVESDPESGMNFSRKPRHGKDWDHARRVRIPREQYDRWVAAAKAWGDASGEMFHALVKAGGRGW